VCLEKEKKGGSEGKGGGGKGVGKTGKKKMKNLQGGGQNEKSYGRERRHP